MHYIFLILGILGLVAAALVGTTIRSDIQIILVAVCAFGGLTLIGLGYIIAQTKSR
jgi:hypothetical protein